ncbi:MAG: hypothetical protein H0W87_01210 [Actinobacteria bacterium]|nr:hypothetical protein [Actinomycetota bacterium]
MKDLFTLRKVFEIGGIVAGVVLIAFGIATLVIGVNGRSTVHNTLAQEQIVGSPDMTPAAIAPGVQGILASQQKITAAQVKAGVPADQRFVFSGISAPSCSAAGTLVGNGETARCFAQYMRIHALEASGGLTYAQMGRYVAKPGTPAKFTDFNGATSIDTYALVDATTKQPVANHARDLWVTETALTTALNTSYMAERISLFGLMVGLTLLLSGFGFAILAIGGALRRIARPASEPSKRRIPTSVPTA